MNKRVLICQFKQESNSFCPNFSGPEFFIKGTYSGEMLIHGGGRSGQLIVGAVETLEAAGIECVGGIGIGATSGGPVLDEVVSSFIKNLWQILDAVGTIDGILFQLHGATLSETSDDVCGDILRLLRERVGKNLPIVAGCDLHANITSQMAANADAICGYHTYPHVDFYQTGQRAAKMLMRLLSGEPVRSAYAYLPMMAPAGAYTTGSGSLKVLMEKADAYIDQGSICDYSIFQVQPWLDASVIASTVIVIAENGDTAEKIAYTLAQDEFALRHELQGEPLYSIEEVVSIAASQDEGRTVILADSADSSGAGSAGDSAEPLRALLPYQNVFRSALIVADPVAVKEAFNAGIGAEIDVSLGGKLSPKLSNPVFVKNAKVVSLHTGDYYAQGPVETGQKFSVGPSAVLQVGKIFILATSVGGTQRDIQIYRGFGIEPSLCRLISVKACTSFRAGYASLNPIICNAATPGSAGPILKDKPYTKLPKPFYPFSEISWEHVRLERAE